jgi:hypothetical protein
MGKTFIWILGLALSQAVFAAPAPTKDLLKKSKDAFSLIESRIEQERVYDEVVYTQREILRQKFKAALANLEKAIAMVETERGKAKGEVETGITEFRRFNLMMPYYAIPLEKRTEFLDQIMSAENFLIVALAQWDGDPIVVLPSTPTWKAKGLAWKAIGVFSITEAKSKCSAIREDKTTAWRVPELFELNDNFKDMKNPEINKDFGEDASKFNDVWTSSAGPESGTFRYKNFRTESMGWGDGATPRQVVCIGQDLGNR